MFPPLMDAGNRYADHRGGLTPRISDPPPGGSAATAGHRPPRSAPGWPKTLGEPRPGSRGPAPVFMISRAVAGRDQRQAVTAPPESGSDAPIRTRTEEKRFLADQPVPHSDSASVRRHRSPEPGPTCDSPQSAKASDTHPSQDGLCERQGHTPLDLLFLDSMGGFG